MLNSKAIDIPFDYSDEDFTDIEILCARHVLWLYGGEGEKMDLSGKAFLNVDFSGKDLNGADFENCKFYYCTFDNASLVNCNLQNALFSNCSLYNVTAEEAELQNARFFSCNLAKAFFTHSNFKEAVFKSCQTTSSSFMNCCIENIALEEKRTYPMIKCLTANQIGSINIAILSQICEVAVMDNLNKKARLIDDWSWVLYEDGSGTY